MESDGEVDQVQVSEGDIGVGLGLDENGGLNSKGLGLDLVLVGPGDDSGLDDDRNNRDTVDDPSAQRLTWAEIEELKRKGGGSSGRVSRRSLIFSSFPFPHFPLLSFSFFTGEKIQIMYRNSNSRTNFWLGGVCMCTRGGEEVVFFGV